MNINKKCYSKITRDIDVEKKLYDLAKKVKS